MEINKIKKIAIFAYTYLPTMGGEQIEIRLLLSAIDKYLDSNKKYEFYFIAPNKESYPFCQFRNIKVDYLNLKKIDKWNLALNSIKLAKILSEIKPDVVHTFSIIPGGLMLYIINLIKNKYNYIISSHGNDLAIVKNINYGRRLNRVDNFISKIIVKREIFHQVPSYAMVRFCREINIPNEKIIVIPNAVSDEIECVADKVAIEKIKKQYNLEKGDFVILSLSSSRKVKGMEYLIEGFSKACKINRNLKLLIASGEAEFAEELKKKINQHGFEENIKFIGLITGEKKEVFFKIADVFCMPSLFESFGLALVEAMQRGKLCIATDKGGMQEIIEDNINGLVIKAESSESIAEKIEFLYKNPDIHKKLQENAEKTAEKYKIKFIIPQFIQLYDKAI